EHVAAIRQRTREPVADLAATRVEGADLSRLAAVTRHGPQFAQPRLGNEDRVVGHPETARSIAMKGSDGERLAAVDGNFFEAVLAAECNPAPVRGKKRLL